MNNILRGLYSIAEGLADIASFGAFSQRKLDEHYAEITQRSDRDAIAEDWRTVCQDFQTVLPKATSPRPPDQ